MGVMFIPFGNGVWGHGSRYLPVHEKTKPDCLSQFFISACGPYPQKLEGMGYFRLARDSADSARLAGAS